MQYTFIEGGRRKVNPNLTFSYGPTTLSILDQVTGEVQTSMLESWSVLFISALYEIGFVTMDDSGFAVHRNDDTLRVSLKDFSIYHGDTTRTMFWPSRAFGSDLALFLESVRSLFLTVPLVTVSSYRDGGDVLFCSKNVVSALVYQGVMGVPSQNSLYATGMDYRDSAVFCNRISEKEGFPPAYAEGADGSIELVNREGYHIPSTEDLGAINNYLSSMNDKSFQTPSGILERCVDLPNKHSALGVYSDGQDRIRFSHLTKDPALSFRVVRRVFR